MESDSNQKMKALYIIVNAGFGEDTLDIIRQCGSRGATIVNARGTGQQFAEFLGSYIEPEREIIISVVPEDVANCIMATIKEKANPRANGICFAVPVDKVIGINKQEIKKSE